MSILNSLPKNKSQNKDFSDIQYLKEFFTRRPVLHEIFKKVIQAEGKPSENPDLHKGMKSVRNEKYVGKYKESLFLVFKYL